MPSETQHTLALLQAFWADVWGNNSIFKEKLSHQSWTVEYLHFGNHLEALQSFCSSLIEMDKLLVFEEYRSAMNEFNRQDTNYWRGACITGQPGIGKSMFIAYAVIEQLREKQPVAVQLNLHNYDYAYVIFSANGVTPHKRSEKLPLKAYPGIWALSDSNEDVTIPTLAFTRTVGVRVFQTTSPDIKRWKDWTKQRDVDQYFMDLPSNEEMEGLACISGHDAEKMRTFAVKWGHVPHTLLQLCKDPDYEEKLQERTSSHAETAAENINLALAAIRQCDNLCFPGASSIFFMGPRKENNVICRNRLIVFVPTNWITTILGNAIIRANPTKQIDFINIMSAYPDTHLVAGWIFEMFIHRLSDGSHRGSIGSITGCGGSHGSQTPLL